MSFFDRFFKEEQKPIAAIGGDAPAQPVEIVGANATTKLKLNFKRLPKKVLQAIADQTTGETIIRESDEPKPRGGITDEFNAAARGITGSDDRERLRAAAADFVRDTEDRLKKARENLDELQRRAAAMTPPRMPRGPSFGP